MSRLLSSLGVSIPTASRLASRFVTLSASILCLAPSAAFAQGGPPDFSAPFGVQIVQSVQYGATPLVARKSTFVRVLVQATGTVPPGTKIDGLMRVLVSGVEIAGSPVYSDNGPIVPQASPLLTDENASLNFVFLPPVSNDVSMLIEINPAGPTQVPESDFTNNMAAAGHQNFVCRGAPELVYVPIDYQPGGGPVPNPPDAVLIEPGMGDSFVEGIYATGDWNYHRSVVPSKLWTSSVAGSGVSLMNSLAVDMSLMVPIPDFIYGFVPGGLGYNGMTLSIPGSVAMGNTEPIRYQRTLAHELGHCFGLSHNSTTVNAVGVDVEGQLLLPLGLPTIKDPSLKDVMYAGLLTQEAWVAENTFNISYNSSKLVCALADQSEPDPQPSLLIAGLWNRATGAVELTHALSVDDGRPTESLPYEQADLVVRAYAGATAVGECAVPVNTQADCDGESAADSDEAVPPVGGFAVVIAPTAGVDAIDRVDVLDRRTGAVLWQLLATPSAPVVAFDPPAAGAGALLSVAWHGSDADGDELRYALRYSPDGVRKVPLATDLVATKLDVDLDQLPALQPGRGFLELLASDGLNTTTVRTRNLPAVAAAADGGGNAPWLYVTTPDQFVVYPKGATVILHANAWDLEDLMLDGPSVVWTSNIDGPIGTGRLTSVANLSLGTHLLTVTATDQDSDVAIDTVFVRIVDRVLPGAGETCQPSLGFGGPGSSALSMCGGDLSSGTTADLELSNALPGALAWMAAGTSSNPTPIFGGTLVPLPIATLTTGTTDAAGTWTFTGIPGGGGPNTVYVQAAYLDLAQPELAAFSNALQIDFLP